MGKVLDALDYSWQAFFDGIKAPMDPNSVSVIVLRALLSLRSDEVITDRHEKWRSLQQCLPLIIRARLEIVLL